MDLNLRDKFILTFLEKHRLWLRPAEIYLNMDQDGMVTFTEQTLRNRLKHMEELGLVESYDAGERKKLYRITDSGAEVVVSE